MAQCLPIISVPIISSLQTPIYFAVSTYSFLTKWFISTLQKLIFLTKRLQERERVWLRDSSVTVFDFCPSTWGNLCIVWMNNEHWTYFLNKDKLCRFILFLKQQNCLDYSVHTWVFLTVHKEVTYLHICLRKNSNSWWAYPWSIFLTDLEPEGICFLKTSFH